jgi:cGMP-dependent protein kinase
MFYCDVNEETFVFEAGELGHCFFIVEKGILELLVNGKFKKELKPQDGKFIFDYRFWIIGASLQHP